eukprot:4205862-Amphidinium_carterae.1
MEVLSQLRERLVRVFESYMNRACYGHMEIERVKRFAAGIPDGDVPQEESVPTMVTTSNNRLCMPLCQVMILTTSSSAFTQARARFVDEMLKKPTDVMVDSVLECGLLCALTCSERLNLGAYAISCPVEQVEPGALFKKKSAQGSDLEVLPRALTGLREKTLYYEEGNSLPITDIWFKRVTGQRQQLFLIDCGGAASERRVREKVSSKKRQLTQLSKDGQLAGWEVTAIVFAPAAAEDKRTENMKVANVSVLTVGGGLANIWLGSWAQLFQYMPAEQGDAATKTHAAIVDCDDDNDDDDGDEKGEDDEDDE